MAFDHIVWSGSSFGNASLIDFHCLVFPFLFLIKSGASSFNLDFCTELLICLNNNLTVHCKLDIVNSTGWPGLIEFDLILLDIWTCHWPLWRSKLIHLPQNVYRVSLFYRYSTMSIFFRCRCQCNPNRMKTKRVIGTKKRPTNKNNTIESSGCFFFFFTDPGRCGAWCSRSCAAWRRPSSWPTSTRSRKTCWCAWWTTGAARASRTSTATADPSTPLRSVPTAPSCSPAPRTLPVSRPPPVSLQVLFTEFYLDLPRCSLDFPGFNQFYLVWPSFTAIFLVLPGIFLVSAGFT